MAYSNKKRFILRSGPELGTGYVSRVECEVQFVGIFDQILAYALQFKLSDFIRYSISSAMFLTRT
jgi:hypothetical protein